MKRSHLGLLCLLASAGSVQGQALVPQDFAFAQTVAAAPDAAAYRIALPLAVYQNTAREDLADLRVFNSDGNVVPYSLSWPQAQSAAHQAPVPLPLFPLHEGAKVIVDGLRLTINSPGTAINLQAQNDAPAATVVGQYILDGRATQSSISALELSWPETKAEYSGRLRVEASDDLASWRTVASGAPIANLRANDQAIIEKHVTLSPTTAKFWRISWIGTAPPFELTSVFAQPTDTPVEPTGAALDVVGVRNAANPAEYVFDLGAHPPVSRINVLLPDANSVLSVSLSSRRRSEEPWRPVIQAGFYRINGADGEQQNSPIRINVDSDRYWQARIVNSGGLPQTPLHLHIEWLPTDVTFLAQGHAPFQLVYGNAAAARAEADLSRLPASLVVAAATLGPPQALGGPTRLVPRPAPFPWTRAVLWGVLLLAVMLLGWMAFGIAKGAGEKHE